ncbi:hypothetical protein ON010_g12199 [Phytophthora cinnamomi]|nr:hypothetical protein ON010_g12199 [Phytophthora cinnamomi]
MLEVSEVEVALASLVDAVVLSVDRNDEVAQNVEVLPIGGYLWKFPSEGSNRLGVNTNATPPPAPQIREYPRKCDRCGVCWVSDYRYELDHLRRCPTSENAGIREDSKITATKLGAARRVWCEVDGLFSRLEWRHAREVDPGDSITSATNFVAFTDIIEVSVLDEPTNSFQIVTSDGRTIVFQWRPGNHGVEPDSDLVSYRLELDARQWQQHLDELSKYARNSPLAESRILPDAIQLTDSSSDQSVELVFEEISCLLLNEGRSEDPGCRLQSRIGCVLQKYGFNLQFGSLFDKDGNSLVHVALNLNLGVKTAAVVSALLGMGIDCNLQNHEGESPMLLIAASGDLATAGVLLNAPSIQVDLPCALGVTAFHVAANAGDVKVGSAHNLMYETIMAGRYSTTPQHARLAAKPFIFSASF